MLPLRPFLFMRHGQTEWNRRLVAMGQQDIPLDATGVSQAQEAAERLICSGALPGHIWTSSLMRARQTAEIVAERLEQHTGCTLPFSVRDDLQECNWGVREGQPHSSESFEKWMSGETPEGGESCDELSRRVRGALSGILEAREDDTPVLVVSHGGVWCALQRAMGWPFRQLHNAIILDHRPPPGPGLPWQITEVETL